MSNICVTFTGLYLLKTKFKKNVCVFLHLVMYNPQLFSLDW